jgi:predicted nucleotidyltransferase
MLNSHFQEFIALLERNRVRYLIVGGYAVGLHGFPRYTGDIDFLIAISEKNAKQILKTLKDFGFGDLGLNEKDFLEEEIIVEIGREPLKIQILTGIDGVTFEECWDDRREVQLIGMAIPFIGIESLLKNKAASPRAKDKIDFEELKRIQGESGAVGNEDPHGAY